MIRLNMFKIADGCGEEGRAQKNQHWSNYEAECLVEIWADKKIQRQLSAIGRKRNIWKNITAKLGEG